MISKRVKEFERNMSLETLLTEVNDNLWCAEKEVLSDAPSQFPFVFILGAHRSGSTLLMQALANSKLFSYPTNLLSRFYKTPTIGAKLQLLLADERFNYRDELKDFSCEASFQSANGKTKGALAPNEFWYFWRRFLPFKNEEDYLSTERLNQIVDKQLLVAQLSSVANMLGKPFATKAMILNYNVDFLYHLFPNAVFIHLKRDPIANVVSGLKARERQLGSKASWYSFKIPEYEKLRGLSPEKQVAGQVFYINKAVTSGLATLPDKNKLLVQYEDFCCNPNSLFKSLADKFMQHGFELEIDENHLAPFNVTNVEKPEKSILDAWAYFVDRSKSLPDSLF